MYFYHARPLFLIEFTFSIIIRLKTEDISIGIKPISIRYKQTYEFDLNKEGIF